MLNSTLTHLRVGIGGSHTRWLELVEAGPVRRAHDYVLGLGHLNIRVETEKTKKYSTRN